MPKQTNYQSIVNYFNDSNTANVFEEIANNELVVGFVKWLETEARNDRGQEIEVFNWLTEYACLVADTRQRSNAVAGCAQLAKTMMHSLFFNYCFSKGLNVAYTYATVGVVDRQVTTQQKPLLPSALQSQGMSVRELDSYTNAYWRSAKFQNSAYFVGMSNSSGNNEGGAGQSAKIVSFTADIVFVDECSQTPREAIEQLMVRMDASRIDTKPIRLLGTAGSGNGIELFVDKADMHFEPHVICRHCAKITTLSPVGALVKLVDGKYHDDAALPLEWRYSDESDKLNSAYFGCEYCDSELPEALNEKAFYYCRSHDITLKDYLKRGEFVEKTALTISPLLRPKIKASAMLKDWVESGDKQNFFQQRLGLPYVLKGNAISFQTLVESINRPLNMIGKAITIAGIDQGVAGLYTTIYRYYYATGGTTIEYKLEQAESHLLFAECINLSEVNPILAKYGVNFLVMDTDPNRHMANQISRKAPCKVLLVDQRSNQQKELYKSVELKESGITYKAVAFRHDQIKSDLVLMFNDGRVRVGKEFEKFLSNQPYAINPMKHLMSVSFNATSGKWERPVSKNDDLFYASMFSLFGLRYHLENDYGDRLVAFYRGL
jgi:hypothetical protein